jgi:hypothetical protein
MEYTRKPVYFVIRGQMGAILKRYRHRCILWLERYSQPEWCMSSTEVFLPELSMHSSSGSGFPSNATLVWIFYSVYEYISTWRPSYRRLSPKLVAIFTDRGFPVVSAVDLYGRILGFLDRSRYFSFQVTPPLYSRRWIDPVPDPLLLRNLAEPGIEPAPLDL